MNALTSLAYVLLTSSAHHTAGPAHINWWTWDMDAPPVGWGLVNFALFVILLVRFARGPIVKALRERHESIKKAVADNIQAETAAQAKLRDIKGKLEHYDAEASKIINRLQADGEAERKRILDAARTYADRLRNDGRSLIQQEANGSKARLSREVAERALQLAEEALKRELRAADQERLLDEAIAEIEKADGAATMSRKRSTDRSSVGASGDSA